MKKIGYFEGLRGLAALVVVNEHLLKLFFALAFSDAAMRAASFGLFEEASFPPFNMLHNGAWAVCVFFVLSGYVLSHSFFRATNMGQGEIAGKVVGRYLRLAIPVTASLVIVWALMGLGAFHFAEVAPMTQSHEVNQYITQPTILDIFAQGFGSALFMDNLRYNPPLWTMSVEMIGSIGIFVLQAIFLSFRNSKNAFVIRMVIYVAMIAVIFPTLYTGFVLGMMLCDLKNFEKANINLEKYAKYWVPVSIVIGLILCAYMIRGLYTNPYRFITIKEFHPYYEYLYNTWGAFFLVAGVSYSKSISTALSAPIFRALGKISFPLYLTHYTVMSSLTAYLYLNLPFDDHVSKAVCSVALSIPFMFVIAYLFGRVVNEPAMLISNKAKAIIASIIKEKKSTATVLQEAQASEG